MSYIVNYFQSVHSNGRVGWLWMAQGERMECILAYSLLPALLHNSQFLSELPSTSRELGGREREREGGRERE